MGAVRIWVQTADKNITIIHIIQTTAAHQLMSWEVKSCVFVINNVLTSNQSSILHIALSSEKDSLSESRYAQIKLKTVIWEDNGGDALMIDLFNWWTGVLWIIVMFLSTLILTASITETLMQRYISPNLMKKQTHPNLMWHEREKKNILGAELYI